MKIGDDVFYHTTEEDKSSMRIPRDILPAKVVFIHGNGNCNLQVFPDFSSVLLYKENVSQGAEQGMWSLI